MKESGRFANLLLLLAVAMVPSFGTAAVAADTLPSWNDVESKHAIIDFVSEVTEENSPSYVAPAERIAVFDNDGTLWSEKPVYFQALFIFDRIKQLAPDHPEWQATEPFASVLKGDLKSALSGGEHALIEMAMATHAGMTTEEFEAIVTDWISTAKHPTTGKLYTEMVYQPMLEVLDYLRANGFKTFIVSGGGIEFMRPWSQRVYGIPPEQVIGSNIKTEFQMRNGKPLLVRLPELNFIDDKEGKPVGINSQIGRRPIMAFGNSDGDLQMLQWTTAGEGARFGLYVHHTDGDREFAYDRDSSVGRLDRGLTEAAEKGWTVVDMKQDWSMIYPAKAKQVRDVSSHAAAEHHYFAKQESKHTVPWGYRGAIAPQFWGQLDSSYRLADTGKHQSPANLVSEEATKVDLPRLVFDYQSEQIVSRNDGHTIQHDEAPGSFLVWGDKRYALEQFHVHTPSEHKIDGVPFDMEIHFVHRSGLGEVVVVAVLVSADQLGELTMPLYTLPNQEGETVAYRGRRNPAEFVPKSREYFTYDGSFTTPPCTEGVKWIVMKRPLLASLQQITQFRSILQANNRPTQPLNGRVVEQSN